MTAHDPLADPVTTIRGVGPRRAEGLARLGILSVGDLLHHFPTRHEDLRRRVPVSELPEGKAVTLHGEVVSLEHRPGRKARWTAVLQVAGERVALVWFQNRYRPPLLTEGWIGFATGVLRRYGGPQLVHPRVAECEDAEASPQGHNRIRPVYRTTEGIDGEALARWISELLSDPRLELDLPWPEHTLDRESSRSVIETYRALHFPESFAERSIALHTLGELELLLFALRQSERRALRARRAAPKIEVTEEIDARIRRRFPFQLTAAQDRAVQEVVADLGRGSPMARLVQGEVGSGKTAVAAYAALAAIAAGYQVALLAPTAPLARQHQQTFSDLLKGARVVPELLIAKSDDSDRIRQGLEGGTIPLVIGTHALLRPEVKFNELALVLIDEEQRFGVGQRQVLAKKGTGVHRLHLSATPIPRTLALALVGDFDLTTVNELPPGRKPVKTRAVSPQQLEVAMDFLIGEVAAGHKVLFVVPRIDDQLEIDGTTEPSEGEADVASVASLVDQLRKSPLGRFPIAELHGRLQVQEQLDRVSRFRSGEVPVLVATTLVEVGLDVAGLTVLWIEGAERFGLAQLHQLRGRLGRRGEDAWCFYTSTGDTELAKERLDAFRDSSDGFALAEEDLRLRGEGEAIGARQSGFLPFRLRHPREDLRRYGDILLRAERGLGGEGWPSVWSRLERFFRPPGA